MGKRHAKVLETLGVTLAGVHDVSPVSCQDLPTDLIYMSNKTMLETINPDLYIISTTTPSHYELLSVAIDSKVPTVLVEKPPFASISESIAAQMDTENGPHVVFNFNRRYLPITYKIKSVVDSKDLGRLLNTNVIGGNIGLAMGGCHWIDVHAFLTKANLVSATFLSDESNYVNPRGPEFRDQSGYGTFMFADGSSLFLNINGEAGHGLVSLFVFETGYIQYDELTGQGSIVCRKNGHHYPTTRYGVEASYEGISFGAPNILESTSQLLQDALSHGSAPGFEAASTNTRALVAAFLSAEQGGRPIMVDDSLPKNRRFSWA